MSNGESKIAISKAALCCGFAIALRALFLGILYPLPCGGGRGWVITSEQRKRSNRPRQTTDTPDCLMRSLPPHLKKNPTPHTRRSERRALGAQDEPIAPVVQIPNAVKLALGANIAPEARVEDGYKIARMIQNNDEMRILWVVLNLDKQRHGGSEEVV